MSKIAATPSPLNKFLIFFYINWSFSTLKLFILISKYYIILNKWFTHTHKKITTLFGAHYFLKFKKQPKQIFFKEKTFKKYRLELFYCNSYSCRAILICVLCKVNEIMNRTHEHLFCSYRSLYRLQH